MSRRFNSFLLRRWDRADGGLRIEIEHIQQGTRVVVASTAAALRWLDRHTASDDSTGAPNDEPGPTRNGPPDDDEAQRRCGEKVDERGG